MPDWSSELRRAIARLKMEPAREASLVEELSQHLGDRYDELRGNGVSDADACRSLREELNDSRLITDLQSVLPPATENATPGLDGREKLFAGVGNDLRQALRLLRLNPGFAMVAILSLALGIGANTAIFELLDAVVMRTLPVPSPQQLADIQEIRGRRIGSTVRLYFPDSLKRVPGLADFLFETRCCRKQSANRVELQHAQDIGSRDLDPGTIDGHLVRLLWRARGDSGHDRYLWNHLLYGGAAQKRDRRAHRARGGQGKYSRHGFA